MPEQEGYLGIINMLTEALRALEDEGKLGYKRVEDLIVKARAEVIKQMKHGFSSLEIGLELGKLLGGDGDQKKP